MARRASNAQRIAHAAAEAEARAKSKKGAKKKETAKPAAKKKPAPKKPSGQRKARPSTKTKRRLKIIWAVGKPGLAPVKTFPYRERSAADKEAEKRGGEFKVMPLKVPME